MGGESRGSIACFATYRPPVPLDIFSCPVPPSSIRDELRLLTDGKHYNYNCRPIPSAALKTILERDKLKAEGGATAAEVDDGLVSGFVFVSERDNGLETLHIALRFKVGNKVKVFSLADIYGAANFSGTRLEDCGCFGGGYVDLSGRIVDHFLVYVSTKEPVEDLRSPWTAVYKTNLRTGTTERLSREDDFDLSLAVSPTGKRVAVATFELKYWAGKIEDMETDIFVMDVAPGDPKRPKFLNRVQAVTNGGWPSWGSSDKVIFFHRKVDGFWRVFRHTIDSKETVPVTPETIDAVTPAGISDTEVAVATIRQKTVKFTDERVEAQYRHIEIFDLAAPGKPPVQITQKTRPKADHYNPFVLDGGVGYHRCRSDLLKEDGDDVDRNFHKLESPVNDVGLFRVSGVFPTISNDGSKLAFVDNEFKSIWLADSQGLRNVYATECPDNVFSPMFNQNPGKDTLYFCYGPSFSARDQLDIFAVNDVSKASGGAGDARKITEGKFNNAFPSSSPDGNKFVFRSTRDGGEKKHKNLYIMENENAGEIGGKVTRLTNGPWTDTHCQWSPSGDWIVFSSTRDKPEGAPLKDNDLDPGYFSVYLVKWNDPALVIRVVTSGDMGGHVNHPVFSPDGRSIAFTADLAGVSADPISLPLFLHSVRPYGDIFAVDIDTENISKNADVKKFHRITHSRYEYSTPAWTVFATDDPNAKWNMLFQEGESSIPATAECPYAHDDGGESWQMTGHLIIPNRCC